MQRETYFQYDVVIVGAGLSGLTSAYNLHKYDSSVTFAVIEGKDRIGGRTYGQELKCAEGSNYFDMGGQWVGRCQPHIMKLIKELDMEVYKQYINGTKVLQVNGKVSTYNSEIPSMPIHSLLDLHLFMRKVERLRKSIPVNNPCQCPYAREWDSMTVEEVLRKWVWTSAARETIRTAGRAMFGSEACDMSFLYYLLYAQAAGGIEPLVKSGENMGQEFKVKGGAFQICHKLMAQIGEDKVHQGQAVCKIVQKDRTVSVYTIDGRCYKCERLIMAIPPHEAVKIEYYPRLPMEKLYVFSRMPVGFLTKIVITYDKAFWKEKGLSGEFVTDGGTSKHGLCRTGPLNIGFDATSEDEKKPAIVTFIGGDQQLEYAELQPDDRKRAVLHSISELLGVEALEYIDYAEKNWNEEPYNGGCPVNVATPGVISRIAPGLRYPWKRVHFAGTESATVWCGFLNGAVQSGERAAYEVLYNLRPSSIKAEHIEETFYNMQTRRPRNESHCIEPPKRQFYMYRIIIPAASVIITVVVVRKMLLALAFNKPWA